MYDNHELMAAVELAAKMYHTELMRGSSTGRHRASRYLTGRRLFAPTVEAFLIGYVPPAKGSTPWIVTKFGGDRVRLLLEAGVLVTDADGRLSDPMEDRIVFPQANPAGKFVGFVGRTIGASGKDKYLSTPTTPIFRRTEILYRIDKARRGIEATKTAILVEGLVDAVMLQQAGVKNAVAAGTRMLSDAQAQILARYARNLEVMFDHDEAGEAGFDELRARRGTYFKLVSRRVYPAHFKDPAEWVMDQIDRMLVSSS